MWRVLVQLLRFAFDCWLALAVFALISSLLCGLSGIATLRHNQWLMSFHRYHARAIQELTKPPSLMLSSSRGAIRRASHDLTSMTRKAVVYPQHARLRPARTIVGGRE
jgi:membrane glycosyltransferase